MKSRPKNRAVEDTPHDMMKRIFAVAELIVQSNHHQGKAAESSFEKSPIG